MLLLLLFLSQNWLFYLAGHSKIDNVRKVFAGGTIMLSVLLAFNIVVISPSYIPSVLLILAMILLCLFAWSHAVIKDTLREQWLQLQMLLIASVGLGFIHQLSVGFASRRTIILLSTLAGTICLVRLLLVVRRNQPMAKLNGKQLPTVSLLIPARNESSALTACLKAAVQSDYSKLEILVLDDCSHDKTPDIIRSFAHDGVRFVEGQPPAREEWLGRNFAYEQLARVANGDLLLLSETDVHFSEDSISKLVTEYQARKTNLLSVHPANRGSLLGLLARPLRALWKLIGNANPVHGQCMLIDAHALEDIGGFEAFANEYYFEANLARSIQTRDRIDAGADYGISIAKSWRSHLTNQTRGQFLLLDRNVVALSLVLVVCFLVFIAPFVFIAQSHWLALLPLIIWALVFGLFAWLESKRLRVVALSGLLWPLRLLAELTTLLLSTVLHAFNKISWKQRNICLPMYEVKKRLPKI